jgi:hypothetical protein
VREFRKLSESGHQTAFLSTDYRAPAAVLAPAMFGRWSQENFFRYMRQSFNLDGLVDYRSDNVPETIMVLSPAHRALDGEVRKRVGPSDICEVMPISWVFLQTARMLPTRLPTPPFRL